MDVSQLRSFRSLNSVGKGDVVGSAGHVNTCNFCGDIKQMICTKFVNMFFS